MIVTGLMLTIIGMGVVFFFLIFLVYSVQALGKVVHVLDSRSRQKEELLNQDKQDASDIAAAIVAAGVFLHKA